ncbi:MAG: UDP-N-acetylglucosamine 2-epimerase (non-hydrolyzing) [Actinomycetota bacterium]|nr:UDP-N-acetylglucosamine 2-epimerase (non-hydrolyzing) [Actinomycetota bacterium]
MTVNLVHIVGARPNFMKAAPVVDALGVLGVDQRLIHTGQHYDAALSQVFFDELGLPEPDRYLGIGSGSHGVQTARLLEALETEFVGLAPSGVIVYGDVNSTLAATLAAAKLHIPVAHVEAGLRSFDRDMPEEVNRVVTDSLAGLHLVTSPEAIGYLAKEGLPVDGVHLVGNPMIDTLEKVRPRLDSASVRERLGVPEDFALITLHRPANVDDPVRARLIVAALAEVGGEVPLLFPIHPRGRESLRTAGLFEIESLIPSEPLGYLDFTSLMSASRVVITDSGGIQEETTMLDVPCLTVRPNTERPITITHGTNQLVEPEAVAAAVKPILAGDYEFPEWRPPLWDGHAGERAAAILARWSSAERPS